MTDMTGMLTPRQSDALREIKAYIAENGYAPTLDELQVSLDLRSKSGVFRLLTGFSEKGVIRRGEGTRQIEVIGDCPYCGHMQGSE